QVLSGDYGHLVSTDGTNDDWIFSVYPGDLLAFKTHPLPDGTQEFAYFPNDPVIPPWMPFLAPDPQGEPDAVLWGGSKLWRYKRNGNGRWQPTQLSTQDFGASQGHYLSAFAFSELDLDLGWAMTDDGRVFRSTDRGVTWDKVSGSGLEGSYLYGSTVLPS